jgi:CheY-like chemotaxis protein
MILNEHSNSNTPQPPSAMNKERYRILLADDDADDRLLFKEAFAEMKVKTDVVTVNNGIALMESLHNIENPLPYILFLDLNMPPKDGLECLKEIRNDERLKDLFIAIFSTSDNENDVDETFNNGANIYIHKPNDFNVLKQLLQKAISATFIYEGDTFNKKNFLLRI